MQLFVKSVNKQLVVLEDFKLILKRFRNKN